MKKWDKVKIKGILGIILFIVGIVFVKYATAFNLYPNGASELIAYSTFLILLFSIYLSYDYIGRLMEGK